MKTTTMCESEYRSLHNSEERVNVRELTDISKAQVDAVANLLRDYDEQQLKYMLFAAQTCIASANIPESLAVMKEAAIGLIADLYRAIDGCYD